MVNVNDEIEKLAYEMYEKNGRVSGRELDNWLAAEQVIQATSSSAGGTRRRKASAAGRNSGWTAGGNGGGAV